MDRVEYITTLYDFLSLDSETKEKLSINKQKHIEPHYRRLENNYYFLFNNKLIKSMIKDGLYKGFYFVPKGIIQDEEINRVEKNYNEIIKNSSKDKSIFNLCKEYKEIYILRNFLYLNEDFKKNIYIGTDEQGERYFYEGKIINVDNRFENTLYGVELHAFLTGKLGRKHDEIEKNYKKIITQSKIENF